ncbi:MAG: hypothetical protein AAFR21_17050 [Pseudomonadota bacterium]
MTRNWGIPNKEDPFGRARDAKPLATLAISAVFGIIGASVAAISFNEARQLIVDVFHGVSLIAVVIAAGFGCWLYVFISWSRFAAQFTGGDAFSDLLKFYARAALALGIAFGAAAISVEFNWPRVSVLMFAACGGAAAAAAFQTVLAFVPPGARPSQ